jgi:transposase
VFFEDEARFGQQGTLTRVWARRGSRPRAVRQTQYDYLWVIGAVCPQSGQAEGLLAPHLNTEVVNIFLQQFSTSLSSNAHAVLVWDGAGYHTSKKLVVPDNISLVRLPPTSPELNPIENLWHYLRSHHWSNRSYIDYDALADAAIDSWQRVALKTNMVQTICHADYLESALID